MIKITQKSFSTSIKPALKNKVIATESFLHFEQTLVQKYALLNEKESEENQKKLMVDFLEEAFYTPNYHINTKGRNDTVIHKGKSPKDTVGVIIEAKKTHSLEMISEAKPNVKALHELIWYYFNEREHNHEICHLIATDFYHWFIFDENEFDDKFYQNTSFKKLYKTAKDHEKGSAWFYDEVKKLLITSDIDLFFNYIDFKDLIGNEKINKLSKRAKAELYKILSPEHLLKLSFSNDSNQLNQRFYHELLHIIGLEEAKEESSNKKIIRRVKDITRRNEGSLLENTINELEVDNVLGQLSNPEAFGNTTEEQLFSVGLELCITWLNRVLFLKLLESQLIKYHNNDYSKAFLHSALIQDFDVLSELFFEVLARRIHERKLSVQKLFGDIPYLNSSLFELTELEQKALKVKDLKDRLTIPYYDKTVLKDPNGKRSVTGEKNTLAYLLAFLDAYSFGSEDTGDSIQDQPKDLISASVLGLIFEKINGYRDGSFFTPGFITMYMCQETIRRATVQKFNDHYKLQLKDFEQLKEHIEFTDKQVRQEANTLINSLRICDPAVGSGHFLVSALNELIQIKYDLGVLQYQHSGDRISKAWLISIDNDELRIVDKENQEPFVYNFRNPDAQALQESLFLEKQLLIENCLFGVDINPKSVSICQLRLWVELLKNAFYKTTPEGKKELETLPNIDINIKTGNSLVSKYPLDTDLSKVLRSIKYNINQYRGFVQDYKNASSKEEKRGLERIIADIKGNFRTEIAKYNNPEINKLNKLKEELYVRFEGNSLFGSQLNAKQIEEREKLEEKINKLDQEIKDSIDSPIYRNAFEWRFEFPEVLDDTGNFIGFDVVIGNPPYIKGGEFTELKPFLQKDFPNTFTGNADLYVYFVERGLQILKKERFFSYIIPNKWMRASYGLNLRKYLKTKQLHKIIDFGDLPVFEEATTYPSIFVLSNTIPRHFLSIANVTTLAFTSGIENYLNEVSFETSHEYFEDEGWLLSDLNTQKLVQKLKSTGKPLSKFVENKVFYGIKTGLNEAFVIDADTKDRLIAEDKSAAEIIKPFLAGREVKGYQTPKAEQFLILFEKGFTNKNKGDFEGETWLTNQYPSIFQYLKPFAKKASVRSDKGEYWWELRACDYYKEFEQDKIIYPNICRKPEFTFDVNRLYANQKCFIIAKDDKYLLGVLNSNVIYFLFKKLLPELRGGFYEPNYAILKDFPIPKPDAETASLIIEKVESILIQKRANPQADTSAIEAEIDDLVYKLYDLSEEEISIIQ
ncbi:Eco57I restriction-modification methylase domain-containing protein [Arcicella rosea]|uniref:site-specific DNA-methyltransferase (adenine-specific) n=1 Tax=Arcicella rosea TaxID=502909 RepID=A0A841EIU1_9BACT|nr:Eco57I restriction-modification methylase domain-containing protein [Arcicella rosea]MBB6002134.1 type II restriction/modification system DNA methylase subunit YeeA [Arcicella rosea]